MKDIGLPNYAVTRCGKVYSLNSNKYLKPKVDRYGYEAVCMRANNENVHNTVHRLVALTYLPTELEDATVNHIDGNKLNNSLINLEWISSRDNARHAMNTGLTIGTALTDEEVHSICKYIQDGFRNCDIKQILGVETITTIEKIRSGKHFTDISREYDFSKNSLGRRQTISTPKIIKVCELLQDKQSVSFIAKKVSCSSGTVYRVKNRTRFTSISNNYDW